MNLRNESIGAAGYASGAYGGAYYGGGCYPMPYPMYCNDRDNDWLIALALFQDKFHHGDYHGAHKCLCDCQAQFSLLQAEVGDVKYENISNMMNQTIGLLGEINNGRVEHLKSVFDLSRQLCSEVKGIEKDIHQVDRDVLINRYELDKEMQKGFHKLDANNFRQTVEIKDKLSDMQHYADKCCCETNRNIERTAFETQLRDLANKSDTDKQLAEIKCLIKETADKQELERLKRLENQSYISGQVNRAVNATLGHWGADAQFNGVTYPQPPTNLAGAWY